MGPLSILVAFVIAAVTALSLTYATVTGGNGGATVQIGPWVTGPRHGTTAADPYARATYARLGTLPLGIADGLAFIAREDSAGRPLDGRCTIRIKGRMPPARFWTIGLLDADAALIENPARRQGFTSGETVWAMDGSIDIIAGPRARAGNWLPTGGKPRLMVVLRLYDTPVGFASRASSAPQLPAIQQGGCP